MNNTLIQVLWVEDDPMITAAYPLEAANYGLQLVPFSCWEEAEIALRSDFKRWSAIILDAKCKYKKDSHDNATQFLMQALTSISSICVQYGRILPWYILSGGSEEELSDLILDSREEWDGDWKKKYYSKNTDRELLFHRIPHHARVSPEMQIRLVLYPDVFKAIRRAKLDVEVENYMEDLLLPIHARHIDGKEYNNRMTLVRKVIEYLFQSMASNGLLPSKRVGDKLVLSDKLVDKRGGINLTWCSKIISGKNAPDDERVIIASEVNIIPNVLKESIQRLIEVTAANEHFYNKDVTEDQFANSRHTPKFLETTRNAPYLLRGMAMELCSIILWYDRYLLEHPDEEINALNWNVIA